MRHSTPLRNAVCVAALFAGGAAQADVTALEVWESVKSQMEIYGEDGLNIGSEEVSGGTVTVSDIALTFSDDEITAVTEIGDMIFTEQGDGTVLVTMAESYPIVITGDDGVVITIDVTQSNFALVVSGDPARMNYAFTADSYGIDFRDLVDGDVTITGDARLIASDLSGSYLVTEGEMREIASDIAIRTVDVLVDFQVPGGAGEYVTAAAKINGLTSSGIATIPADADFEDPDTLLMSGFGFSGGYEITDGSYVFDINADGDQASGSVSTGAVSLSGEFNAQTLAYESSTQDIAANFLISEFPLPIDISAAQYGVTFRIPVGMTEEPAPFAFGFDLVDLNVSEMVWDIFDAGGVLPRDPATLQIAISGTAKVLLDLLDPANAAALDGQEPPFEPESITLDTFRISAVGALITGGGAFTFDNTDTQTFAPMPRPEGSANVEITGLNALLDNLVAMGLVPADQIMGPRMMMGMFARATGPDQMAVELEVTPNGQVNVNGNRVR
ncbi:DUF2125 domain-containing protein [Yoonia sp.]|uniref:DUF2125 domain-containing protein n=1 Tax=Yoonia sp. TaxID=2212373 RepID=UPI002FDB4E2A